MMAVRSVVSVRHSAVTVICGVIPSRGKQVTHDADHREHDRDGTARDQPRVQRRLDVAQVLPVEADLQQGPTEQQQQHVLRLAPHRRPPSASTPASSAQPIAARNVVGANLAANPRPNTPDCNATSLTSTAGPTTRNTSRGSSGNADSDAATNASASLHSASTTASTAITSTASTMCPASESNTEAGTTMFSTAEVSAPSTRNPLASTRSCLAVSANTASRDSPAPRSTRRSARSANHSSRPNRAHSQPITTAVPIDPRNRATTIRGSPGKATAADTSTTGLTAGAASRNVSAAAGGTPCCISRRDTGTDAHSQPGSASPASPATGTAAASLRGSSRRNAAGGTNAAIRPLISTPSTRNGKACTTTATNTVAPVWIAGWSSIRTSGPLSSRASTSSTHKTSSEVMAPRFLGASGRLG